jgi:hypothetical protein
MPVKILLGVKMSKIRTYSELRKLETLDERFDYLSLKGSVGESTFGFDRWMNQQFYRSREWKHVRSLVIYRDNGCDLGIPGFEIHFNLLVHHMNPVSGSDITDDASWILNPEYLITTSKQTHNAIHYGDASLLPRLPVRREPGDTALW